MPIYPRYRTFLTKQAEQHLLRQYPQERVFALDFTHNDYLNLSQHPALIAAGIEALQTYGAGNKASRLIGQQQQKAAKALETQIAADKHTEQALILCSGFQTNVSVIPALLDARILGKTPLVFCDKLNHASMHLGCALAGAKQIRYRHLDVEHLSWQLQKYKNATEPKFILSESVFGMEGDKADLAKLIQLAKDYQAFLYIDEAHATGLFGPQGYGLSTDFPGEIDCIMGTFSKALGCFGAYIACNKTLHDYLLNRCQGLIYTTMVPPAQIAMMQAAWQLVPSLRVEVSQLFTLAECLRTALHRLGVDTGNSQTHIVPLRLQCPEKVLQMRERMAQQGIGVAAVRPPSVMPLESRVRIALNLQHTKQDLDRLVASLQQQA